MIPVFVAVFYCGLLDGWCYLASAGVFLLAALTDALDGHIARSRNLVTDLGKFLDPIADKVLVSTAFIVLLTVPACFTVQPFGSYGSIIAGIFVALILARELIVLAADKLGKIKTVFQDVAIAFLLAALSFLVKGAGAAEQGLYAVGEIVAYIGLACFALCTLLTVVSGVHYIVRNKQVLADGSAAGEKS